MTAVFILRSLRVPVDQLNMHLAGCGTFAEEELLGPDTCSTL